MKLFRKGASPPPRPERPPPQAAPPISDPAGDYGPITYAFTPELVVGSAQSSPAAAAVRDTALELLSLHLSRGRRSLAVCGVNRGAGVSFLCANLALALAMDGVSTLVIDADLRHPSLEHFVQPSRPPPGLQHYLRSPQMSRDEIIHAHVAPGLSLIYAGGVVQQASELVGLARFRDLVHTCMRDYDLVILDTPPASLTADTRHIAAVSHYALIVARARSAHVDGVEVLAKSLLNDGVEIVGSVLNAV